MDVKRDTVILLYNLYPKIKFSYVFFLHLHTINHCNKNKNNITKPSCPILSFLLKQLYFPLSLQNKSCQKRHYHRNNTEVHQGSRIFRVTFVNIHDETCVTFTFLRRCVTRCILNSVTCC